MQLLHLTNNNTRQRWKTKAVAKTVSITDTAKFVAKEGDFLSNERNRMVANGMITERLRQKGCYIIQAEGDADVYIVKAAVTMCISCSTTLIRKDTDLLILLLYYYTVSKKNVLTLKRYSSKL